MPYLLKIIVRGEDPTRHYENMWAAAEAGLDPRVWYTDTENRISITDFVRVEPLSRDEAGVRMPGVLRTLHGLAPFGRAPFNTTWTFLLNKWPEIDPYVERFRTLKLLPVDEIEEFFDRYAELASVYPYGDGEMVASHNDLFKPDNVRFDGKRVWLADWEAAFLNDRYADLAVVANQLVRNEAEEREFLTGYWGSEPDAYQLARFHLMRQRSHLFCTMAFLALGSRGNAVDMSVAVPEYGEFHQRRWAGEFDETQPEVKVQYGSVHWARLIRTAVEESTLRRLKLA
ncbi:MAG: hypothetical protein EBY17_23835 [Acidobacteriia bacterium]|nr:hypothetical protein [Terriglobia bacterium]